MRDSNDFFDMNKLNMLASPEYIEWQLEDIRTLIESIENHFNTVLIGDRSDMDSARRDWRMLTRGQVMYAVSLWKKGILDRYYPESN